MTTSCTRSLRSPALNSYHGYHQPRSDRQAEEHSLGSSTSYWQKNINPMMNFLRERRGKSGGQGFD